MLLLSLPWLLLALAAWRANNVAGRSNGLGGPDIRSAKSATERAIGGGPAGGAPSSGEGQTLGVMAATASSWDGSHLGSHDAPGAEPFFHPEAVAPPPSRRKSRRRLSFWRSQPRRRNAMMPLFRETVCFWRNC